MTNLPPQSGGWIDGSGHLNPGAPPQGYWQASDGRWYPPDLSSSATQAVGQQYNPQMPSGPPPGPGPAPYGPPQQFAGFGGPPQGPQPYQPPAGSSGSKNGLIIALGALTAVVVLGVIAAVALRGGDDDGPDPTVALPGVTTLGGESTAGDGSTAGVETTAGGGDAAAGGELGTCVYLDADYLQVDLTNSSDAAVDYYLTIILRNDAGDRVGDTSHFIEALRPGERAVVPVLNFENESGGTTCEVAEADPTSVDTAEIEGAASSTCEITGEDSFSGNPTGTVSLMNTGSDTLDLYADIAIMDANGVRVDATTASASAVAAGESAPADLFLYSPVLYDPSLTCEVVAIYGY